MTLIQCVDAYNAAAELSEQTQDYKTAYALVRLKRKLRPQAEFFLAEESKLVEEYAARDEKGNIIFTAPKIFKFRDGTLVGEYVKRHEELAGMDVQEEFTPWHAPAPATIKPKHLEALDGFLIFDGPEGSKDA